MTIQSEIDRREAEIRALKAQQAGCDHQWGEVVYDPYMGKKEVLTGRYETHGVHMWPITRFVDEEKPRWKRVCQKCGKPEYTEKMTEIKQVVKKEPDFG